MRARRSFWKTFSRSQLSSAVASAVDFGLLFGLKEWFHVWYVLSVAIGAAAGAVTNFVINRQWSFQATEERVRGQAFRYFLVASGSLALNTGGVYAVTEWGHVHYAISVAIVTLFVGFIFNYPLQRYYVFKH